MALAAQRKLSPKAQAKARFDALQTAKAAKAEARHRARLVAAWRRRVPKLIEAGEVGSVVDEHYQGIVAQALAAIPKRQHATHLSKALTRAVKAVCDGMNKRSRKVGQ